MNAKGKSNQGGRTFLEDRLAAACVMNGATFATEYQTMNYCDISVVTMGAALAVKKAAALGLLTDEELSETRYQADRLRAEEEARRKALAEEEARLRAELADFDENDAENA